MKLSENDVGSRKSLDGLPSPTSNGTSENDQPAAIHEEAPPTNDAKQDQAKVAAKTAATDSTQTKETENLSRNHSCDKRIFDETMVSPNAVAATPWRSFLRLNGDWNSEYSSVRNMLDYLRIQRSGSLQSAQRHCIVLAGFCKSQAIDPNGVAGLPREQIEAMARRHCNLVMERCRLRGPSARTANAALACLKTFFASNGFNRENASELRVRSYHQPPRTVNRPEYIPILKEALVMADRSGSKRDRAIILTLITTGIRNTGLRAMQIGDVLSELKEEKKVLLIKLEPSWNIRIAGACKNNIPYWTFTAKAATEAIESMLRERELTYGSYSPEEPLFASNYNQIEPGKRRMKTLTTRELEMIVKKAAQAADVARWKDVHVHTMRKVFESVLRSPLADGTQMDHKDQEFLMGHLLPGSQENYYDRTKVEKLREVYSKLVFEDRPAVQELSLQTTRRIAKLLGVDYSQVKASKEKELGRPLTNQEEEQIIEETIKLARERKGREEQAIIELHELENYLRSGWKFVSALPNGKAVVCRAGIT
jgi:integrase